MPADSSITASISAGDTIVFPDEYRAPTFWEWLTKKKVVRVPQIYVIARCGFSLPFYGRDLRCTLRAGHGGEHAWNQRNP